MKLEETHPTGNTQQDALHLGRGSPQWVHTKNFAYGGWDFLLGAERVEGAHFRSVVRYFTAPTRELKTLTMEEDTWPTAADAVRRAEFAAIQWFQGRLGDGKGQN